METTHRRADGKTVALSALTLLQAAIWGMGNILTKLAYAYVSPYWLITLRFGISALLFLIFFGRRILRNLRGVRPVPVLVVGLTTAGAFCFAYQSLAMTDATTAGFLMSVSVIFIPFLARLVQGTRVNRAIFPVILVVTAGMYLLCGGGSFRLGLGELCAVASSISYAFSLVYSSQLLRDTDPVALTFLQSATVAAACLGMALIFEPFPAFAAFDAKAMLVLAALAVGCSFVCYLIQNFVLVALSSTLTSLILCSESVFSALGAALVLGERLTTAGYAGAALILVGVVVATLLDAKKGRA